MAMSIQTISLRGVITESTARSPSEKTRPTICCSTTRTSPSSTLSWMIERISSSVTLLSDSLRPSSRVIAAVLRESSHTNGEAATESARIGRATAQAIFSAVFMPIRLGPVRRI